NFSMTDYASQGKTREYNVVELTKNHTYHGIYTSLSRGSSARGTLILGEWNDNEYKIRSGISGYLRQEFRELNMLDHLTTLRYEKKLHESVKGDLRYPLLKSYTAYYKNTNIFKEWHSSLKPQHDNEDLVPEPEAAKNDHLWDSSIMVRKLTRDGAIQKSKEAKPKVRKANQKRSQQETPKSDSKKPSKRIKSSQTSLSTSQRSIKWDSEDFSCAYDSLFTLLYSIWVGDIVYWNSVFGNQSRLMKSLSQQFLKVQSLKLNLEQARDAVRLKLRKMDKHKFPAGKQGIYLSDLVSAIFSNEMLGQSMIECTHCGNISSGHISTHNLHTVTTLSTNNFRRSQLGPDYKIEDALYLQHGLIRQRCEACRNHLTCQLQVKDRAPLLCFGIEDEHLKIGLLIRIHHHKGTDYYRVRGLIYGGDFHFTARIVDKQGQVWYADGMNQQDSCV
ncbi:hypothetical protein FA13DRAFT_1576875, partial [Coprinellus micaceus]